MNQRLKQKLDTAIKKLETIAFSHESNTMNVPFVANWLPLLNTPFPAFQYIKSEMMMGLASNLFLALVFIFYLPSSITQGLACDSILTYWLIVLSFLHIISLIPELFALLKLLKFNHNMFNQEDLGQALFNFIYSNVFVFILSVNNLIFYIYLIGIFRLWQISQLKCDSNIFYTSLSIVCLFFLRIPISFKLFRCYFREKPKSQGLTAKQITGIKVQRMKKQDEIICSICIDIISEGQEYRTLGCQGLHEFHSHCIEKWLLHKNLCPNCNQIAFFPLN